MPSQVEELQRTLAQIQLDSKEIEQESEAELAARTQLCEELQSQSNALKAQKLNNPATRIQELESKLEDFEQSLRIKDVTIENLKEENRKLLERLAIQDADAADQQALEILIERLKQENTDAQEEVIISRQKLGVCDERSTASQKMH